MNDSFLAAIRAKPDDDLPRLIFADYLDERGDPRGEFIRTQIEQAHTQDEEIRDDLRSREAELLEEFEDEWLGPLGDQLYRWWFHRGFLEVSLNIGRFLEDAALLELATVAGIHLHPPSYMDPSLVLKLAADPQAWRVRSLYLGFEWVQDAVTIAVANSKHLSHLEALDLENNGVTDEGVAAIAHSTTLKALRVLALGNNLITDIGAATLARSPSRCGLRQLNLANNEITSLGARELANSPHLAGVSEVNLDGNRIAKRRRRLA